MRKWIPRIVFAVVVLLGLAIVGVFVFLNDIVKKAVETAGPPLTKTEVKLASSKISPLSGSGHLQGLFIGNPEGFKTEFAIKMGEMKVDVDVGSLLSDTIVVEQIFIEGPEITFEGGLKGSNLGRLLDNLEAATGGSDD
ncbi:MAG TPA: hypothetical protein VNO52_12480, partial [Methylomirabilota bacterium]|nr:hypothetical protein [Methylomirabilota bacterium]